MLRHRQKDSVILAKFLFGKNSIIKLYSCSFKHYQHYYMGLTCDAYMNKILEIFNK